MSTSLSGKEFPFLIDKPRKRATRYTSCIQAANNRKRGKNNLTNPRNEAIDSRKPNREISEANYFKYLSNMCNSAVHSVWVWPMAKKPKKWQPINRF